MSNILDYAFSYSKTFANHYLNGPESNCHLACYFTAEILKLMGFSPTIYLIGYKLYQRKNSLYDPDRSKIIFNDDQTNAIYLFGWHVAAGTRDKEEDKILDVQFFNTPIAKEKWLEYFYFCLLDDTYPYASKILTAEKIINQEKHLITIPYTRESYWETFMEHYPILDGKIQYNLTIQRLIQDFQFKKKNGMFK